MKAGMKKFMMEKGIRRTFLRNTFDVIFNVTRVIYDSLLVTQNFALGIGIKLLILFQTERRRKISRRLSTGEDLSILDAFAKVPRGKR